MAKRKTETADTAPKQENGQAAGESVAGYFRPIFEENPALLEGRSNAELLDRWLKDHPGRTEVPKQVKQNLSNIKSVLRAKLRKKPGRPKKAEQSVEEIVVVTATVAAPRKAVRGLETLEEQIDECLTLARNLDREGLESVIALLRKARNEVVWKMGE